MPGAVCLFFGVLSQVCGVILFHLGFSDLDFGTHFHAYEFQFLNLFPELGAIQVKGKTLVGQNRYKSLLGRDIVLLAHVINRLTYFFFRHLDVQLFDLLIGQFFINQIVKNGSADFAPCRVIQDPLLFRFPDSRFCLLVDRIQGNYLVVDDCNNGICYSLRLVEAVRRWLCLNCRGWCRRFIGDGSLVAGTSPYCKQRQNSCYCRQNTLFHRYTLFFTGCQNRKGDCSRTSGPVVCKRYV